MYTVVFFKVPLHHLHHGVLHTLLGIGSTASRLWPLALQMGMHNVMQDSNDSCFSSWVQCE
jgi:hypothetical protein